MRQQNTFGMLMRRRWIGKAAASDSYLNIDRIVAAALSSGAEAVHPGYGFLAENARFAQACLDAGLVFVGPPPSAILAMGDKIAAKAVVAAAGVPVVPGAGEAGMSDSDLLAAVDPRWFPVLIKPSAGGGGKGMRVVSSAAELPEALVSARRTAVAAFGDGTLLVERYVPTPRHIEIQVLADSFGHVIHLGERECSLQRRHQKIVEEAPSPLLSAAQRVVDGVRRCVRRPVRRVRRGGDRGVHRGGRLARRLLLHGDEHAAAGRAPGDGACLRA